MDWRVADKAYNFLETAAALTEHQSSRKYVTLSLNSVLYKKLRHHCELL